MQKWEVFALPICAICHANTANPFLNVDEFKKTNFYQKYLKDGAEEPQYWSSYATPRPSKYIGALTFTKGTLRVTAGLSPETAGRARSIESMELTIADLMERIDGIDIAHSLKVNKARQKENEDIVRAFVLMKSLTKKEVDAAVEAAFIVTPLGMVDGPPAPSLVLSDKSTINMFNGQIRIHPAGSY